MFAKFTNIASSPLRLLVAAFPLVIAAGCPAPEPVAPTSAATLPPSDDEARVAFEQAKSQKDAEALLDVYYKFRKFPSGRAALNLAVRTLLETALEAAEACEQPKAAGALSRVAPLTADNQAIDSAYDETRVAVAREKKRCVAVKLAEDVKRAEAAWDWPRAFERIINEKDAEGEMLRKLRVATTDRWRAWLDDTLRAIVKQRSVNTVVGSKRAGWESSIDAAKLPAELGPELAKRGDAITGVVLIFDKLEDGDLFDPPKRFVTRGTPKVRRPDAPGTSDGTEMANGIPFVAVARGKLGGATLLAAGSAGGDVLERLGSIKLLITEGESQAREGVLPDKLAGERVLVPIAPGSDLLTPAKVITDGPTTLTIQALAANSRRSTVRRSEVRLLTMSPGQAVAVLVNGAWKQGELADAPEAERVLVRVGGFESYIPLGNVRIKRSQLSKD